MANISDEDFSLFSEFLKWKRASAAASDDQAPDPLPSPVGHVHSSRESSAKKIESYVAGTDPANDQSTGLPEKEPEANFQAQDYLSRDKKYSEGKKKFRHVLKLACLEAKCWGTATLKQITPAQHKHIHDRVIRECPSLAGHTREMDLIIAKSLSEAKHYARKKGGEKKAEGLKKKQKLPQKKNSAAVKPTIKPKDVAGTSDYEKKISARKVLHNTLGKAVKEHSDVSQTSGFLPAEDVLLSYGGEHIATAVFVRFSDETHMFCELGFNQHLDRDDESEINLPVPVGENKEAGRAEKKLFAELETDDIFSWKTERVEKNKPKGGYVVGKPASNDVFKGAIIGGTRSRKPNSLYKDFL